MRYLEDLGVPLDGVGFIVISEILDSPQMGQFPRAGFEKGWTLYQANTLDKQRKIGSHLIQQVGKPPQRDFFKQVYKRAFTIGRQHGQKAVDLAAATEYWKLLFSEPSVVWRSETTPWLDWWIEFLERDWKKSVNKDMWDQTYSFFEKSVQDESMSWWDENGAWPGVIDDFVMFVQKEKRGVSSADPMETE